LEVLQVGLGGVLQPLAAAFQERLGQPGALRVVADGALGAVLRPQVPLEGAEQRAGSGAAVHAAELAQLGVLHPLRPLRPAPDVTMTSVSAGHPWWGGGEGI
jgi:hypothetical protein